MSLKIFAVSVIVFFVLKLIYRGINNPLDMLNHQYREESENSRELVALLILISMCVMAISGICSAWTYL